MISSLFLSLMLAAIQGFLHMPIHAFAPLFGVRHRHVQRMQHLSDANDSFMDVEFEKVDETATIDSSSKEHHNLPEQDDSARSAQVPKSLLELSLDLDPQWKLARIPFTTGNTYIDCQLCFTVDLDGTTYGIGVPCDAAVAVTLEDSKGKVTYLNPVENEELIEIMATQLQELVGKDVYLKKTPKILTISGNLDKYTDNWKEDLFNETVSTEELLDDSDEGLDFFYDFMRQELGEEEFQKTLEESKEEGSIDKDLLELFNIPGLGDQADNVEGIEEMLKSMMQNDNDEESFTKLGEDLEHEGVALKLIGFNFRDGKSYSLVKLLKPFTIVGKYAEGEKEDLRFDLLTPEEEKLIIPRLEQVCQKDLEASGLSLQ